MRSKARKGLWFCLTIMILFMVQGYALAREKTVTLSIQNMTCSLCPFTVKKALEAVEGVHLAEVSLEDHNAVVTFDEEQVTLETLLVTTTNAGFPSTLIQEDQSEYDEC